MSASWTSNYQPGPEVWPYVLSSAGSTADRLDRIHPHDDEDDLLRDAHNPNLCDLWLSAEPERGCTCSNGDTT